MKHIIAIDPGVTGAICWMSWVGDYDCNLETWDLPTLIIAGKKNKTVLDEAAAVLMLEPLARLQNALFLLEAVNIGAAMPKRGARPASEDAPGGDDRTSQSLSTLARQIELVGQLRGILAAFKVKREIVQPQMWKRYMMPGEARDKDAARQKVLQLFPRFAHLFARKKDHNRAEAALLAEFGRRRG